MGSQHTRRLLSLLLAAACVLSTVPAASMAVQPAQKRLLTGAALRDALNQKRSVASKGVSLRQTTQHLQFDIGVAVVIDRRVDASRLVNVSTEFVTLEEFLIALAADLPETGVSFADQFVMLGPEPAVTRLRTVATINRKAILALRRTLPADLYRALSKANDVSWPELAEPRQLIVDAAAAVGTTVENPDMIPHDVWSATALPQLAFADFATLVLNQFDLSFEITPEQTIRIIEVAETVEIEQRHRVPAREKNSVIQRWQQAFPELNVTWKGSTAVVMTTVDTHEKLAELIREPAKPNVAEAPIKNRLLTMNATAGTPIGYLVNSFRERGIPIRIEGKTEEELAPLLQLTVEIHAERVPASEFFPEVFKSWRANVTVLDDEVVIKFAAP